MMSISISHPGMNDHLFWGRGLLLLYQGRKEGILRKWLMYIHSNSMIPFPFSSSSHTYPLSHSFTLPLSSLFLPSQCWCSISLWLPIASSLLDTVRRLEGRGKGWQGALTQPNAPHPYIPLSSPPALRNSWSSVRWGQCEETSRSPPENTSKGQGTNSFCRGLWLRPHCVHLSFFGHGPADCPVVCPKLHGSGDSSSIKGVARNPILPD